MGTTYFAAEIAATMSAISGLSDAPPTRKPSMSGNAESSGAFLAFAEPPYLWKSKFYGAFVLNHRVVLHAIDVMSARWNRVHPTH